MAGRNLISSIDVADKMNEWYRAIQSYRIEESRRLKDEVKQMMAHMEENQNVLLYFSLLEFRMLLNEQYPVDRAKVRQSMRLLNAEHKELTGTLDYYYWLFKGMYEFRQKKYAEALFSYRQVEQQVRALEDRIEMAQCYYQLAEVYFELNYTIVSINYSNLALKMFNENPDYYRYSIYCRTIIAANYMQRLRVDEASRIYHEAHETALQHKDQRMIAITRFNIGISEMHQKNYQTAERIFGETVHDLEILQDRYLPKAQLSYFEALAKQGKKEQALQIYEIGIQNAQKWKETEILAKFQIVRESVEDDANDKKIDAAFSTLMLLKLYSTVQDYALETARIFKELGRYPESVKYYELSNHAHELLLKG
ncbi:MAG: hypothetical protein ACE3JK_09195 [Sporolactobacillus sp.]